MTTNEPKKQIVNLNGQITNFSDLPPLENLDSTARLEIRFGPTIFFNSTGIRDWIRWLKPASLSKDFKIEIYECSFSVILLVNMISNFLPPNCKIMSFYIPYYSENTGESKKFLIREGVEVKDGKVTLPEVKDSEGNLMALDVDEKKFFKFLNS